MSSFLVNLALRGAGLPATTIQAPPPSSFTPAMRKHGNESTETHGATRGSRLAEEPAPGSTSTSSPLPTSSSEAYSELPFEEPTHHALSIQHLYDTALNLPTPPAVGEPAATASGLPPAPRKHVLPGRQEAKAAPLEPSTRLPSTAPLFSADREGIPEIEGEHHYPTMSSDAQTIEPVGTPASQVISVAPSSPIIIGEPSESQIVSPAELSAEPPRVGAQQTHKPGLTAPTIHPALDESHTLLQFPKTMPASLPTPPSQLPIHVRIGRVEVRATTDSTPTPARPSPPGPAGFDAYYRIRNYRS